MQLDGQQRADCETGAAPPGSIDCVSARSNGSGTTNRPCVRSRARADDGYAMAALLVALGVMAVMWTVAMPVWTRLAQREKEAELIFRAQQYARAVMLFKRKYANATPPSVDVLLQQKFLRKKYKDPITGQDFRVLSPMELQAMGGGAAGVVVPPGATRTPGLPTRQPEAPPPPQPRLPGSAPAVGPGQQNLGGVAAVVSRSSKQSVRIWKGRQRYDQWIVTEQDLPYARLRQAQPGQPQPGQTQPGGPNQPGQQPGRPGSPTPGQTTPGRPGAVPSTSPGLTPRS